MPSRLLAPAHAPAPPTPTPPADWCSAAVPSLAKSFRLRFDTGWPPANPGSMGASPWANWVVEDMPVQRNQGVAIVLPNGHVLLLSGGQVRRAGTRVVS
jgi:hypothetical protein